MFDENIENKTESRLGELVFIDTEYTTFGETRETGWTEKHHHKEIVQIAAVRFNVVTGQEIENFDILVRPTINSKLTPIFTKITAITQDQVDSAGVTFAEALSKLKVFCGDLPIWTFDKDWFVFEENCRLNNINFPFATNPFMRVKQQLAGWGLEPDKYSSGTLHKSVGLDMTGHVHNALHDVRSMAKTIFVLVKRGIIKN